VVERGERADHAHHRVGDVLVVVGDRREAFDLAHDVVAEVPHQSAVQRREFGQHRGAVHREQPFEGGEDPLVARDLHRQGTIDADDPVAQDQRGDRIAADEREAAPALAMLDRLEQESRAVSDELGVGRDGRLQIAEHLGPHRHHGVVSGEGAELVSTRADRHRGPRTNGR
jgi:hypothetical protein